MIKFYFCTKMTVQPLKIAFQNLFSCVVNFGYHFDILHVKIILWALQFNHGKEFFLVHLNIA